MAVVMVIEVVVVQIKVLVVVVTTREAVVIALMMTLVMGPEAASLVNDVAESHLCLSCARS